MKYDERGEPILPVAGPRGRVFPHGYARPGRPSTPVCRGCKTEMVLDVDGNVWLCRECHTT